VTPTVPAGPAPDAGPVESDLARWAGLFRMLRLLDRAKAVVLQRGRGGAEADLNLAAFYEQAWRSAGRELGGEVEDLGHGVLEIRIGDFVTRVIENSTALDDAATHSIARAKPVIYRLLERAGIPTAPHLVFTLRTIGAAEAFLEQIAPSACVVKPATGSGGGKGVTTGIRSRWQLARAAWHAASRVSDLLLEKEVSGDNYRLLYLDGRLVDTVVRRPPRVVADGVSSISTLVDQVNADRVRRALSHSLLTVDHDMKATLARQGWTLGSTPAQGTVVTLKTAINENSGADNESADRLCPEIVEAGATAARLVGVRLAGVDVITPDPSRPLREAGGVILEVNSPPGYFWHYRKSGGPFPVALHVLQALRNGGARA
jgi:D-alanine-D-alanine ligase-like ATP-grasp enzyme